MDEHHGVRQHEALALGARGEEHRGHGGALADADGGHVALDEVHGVQNAEAGRDRAAGRVDVQGDVLVRIGGLQVQKLGHHGVGHVVVDLLAQEDDAVVEQAAVDVVAALAARRLLDDVGDEGVVHAFDAHRYLAFVNRAARSGLHIVQDHIAIHPFAMQARMQNSHMRAHEIDGRHGVFRLEMLRRM